MRGVEFRLSRFLELGFVLTPKIYTPTYQFVCESNVLTTLAHGQRELVFADDRYQQALFSVDDSDVIDFRRRQCPGCKYRKLTGPFNDINLFAAQFASNRLHVRAF